MKSITYSELAEKLSRQKGKYDTLSKSTDAAEKFTGERMNIGMDMKLDGLFALQESSKTQKGEGVKSYQNGGDPLNRFRNKGYTITPELKSMWDQFQFQTTPRVMAPPTFPNTPSQPTYPIPQGTFQNFFKDSFDKNMLSKKWNTSGYERTKAPTGSFSEVFKRSMAGVRSGDIPTTIVPPVSNPKSNVPHGTGRGTGSGSGSNSRVNQAVIKMPNAPALNNTLALPSSVAGVTGSRAPVPGSKPGEGSAASQTPGLDIMGSVAPFLDNFANIINPIPRLNAPKMLRTPQFETNYNIDPALQEARRGLRTTNRAIDRSVGQGNVAAAYKAGALSDYFRGVGSATATKENTERGLRNQQAQATADVDNANTQLMNNYQLQLTGRQEAQRLARIGQLNNLGEDFMTIRNDKAMRDLDKQKFKVLAEMFKDVIGSSPGLRNMPEFKKYGGKIRR